MSQYNPIVAPAVSSINGFQLARTAARTLSVSSGQCLDNTGINLINVQDASTTVNLSINGLNGLDTGTIAADTRYAIFVINDPSGYNRPGFLASTSSTNPVLPSGLNSVNYSQARRIGWAFTDSSSNIVPFLQTEAKGSIRYYQYDGGIVVLNAGGATTYTAIDLSGAVPLEEGATNIGRIHLNTNFFPGTIPSGASIRASGTTNPVIAVAGQVSSVNLLDTHSMIPGIVSGDASIDYLCTGAGSNLTVSIVGYQDIL